MNWFELMGIAEAELAFKTDAHRNMWGLGTEEEWSFDQEQGFLAWWFADGRRATARAEVVGTFDPTSQSWLWAWGNSSVEPDRLCL